MFKVLFLDIDGVLTNGKKTYNLNCEVVSKEFNDKDFTAIKIFQKQEGVDIIFISGDKRVNEAMAKQRQIPFYFARDNKLDVIKNVLSAMTNWSDLTEVGYVGDDYFDVPVLKAVTYSFCPADAPEYIQQVCETILTTKGGEGIVSELLTLYRKNK